MELLSPFLLIKQNFLTRIRVHVALVAAQVVVARSIGLLSLVFSRVVSLVDVCTSVDLVATLLLLLLELYLFF